MKTRTLKELLLYNYRYWLGHSIVIGFIVYFLGWRIQSLPVGLSQPEIITAAGHINWEAILSNPAYPLHAALQWVSMFLFGVNSWSLRLPSVVIGLFVALALYTLLKRWFGKPTALLSTAIFISADWFLFIARLGTGAIEFSLWLCIALVCLTKLLERKTTWLLLFACSLALLLFAPFGVFAVLTLAVSLFTCRVFRERTAEAKIWAKLMSGLIAVVGLGLFGWAAFNNSVFLKTSLGLQQLPSVLDYAKNILNNLGGVVAVFPNGNPLISPAGIFFVRFFELIFILFGVIMFWRTRVNRLNFVILILSTVLALASGMSAGSRGNGLVLIPAAIFMTAGIRHLLHRWQRTFPSNPYARVTAYAPVAVLFICTVALHYVSYFELWPHQTEVRAVFNRDYELLQSELKQEIYRDKTCFVESSDEAFNRLLSADSINCTPTFLGSNTQPIDTDYLIAREGSSLLAGTTAEFTKALTSDTAQSTVRWLVVNNQ